MSEPVVRYSDRTKALKAGTLLFLLGATPLWSQQALTSISAEVRKVFEMAKNSIVRIEAEDEHGKLAGTGFFIDPNGTILTSYAVAGESWGFVVESGSGRYPARRLVSDGRCGLAMLKIEADTPWLPLGDSGTLKTASPVVTVGFPMDLPATPNFGMIGGFDLKFMNEYFSTQLIRANIAVQRGEAGSPLLDLNGKVVGIVIFPIDNRTASYAVPVKAAEKIRTDYVRFGGIRPGWVGVSVTDSGEPVRDSKVVIESFAEGSPAVDSGLQPGDVLLRIGSTDIHVLPDVRNASFFLSAQEDVPITVMRDGEELTFTITATDFPAYQPRTVPLVSPVFKAMGESTLRFPEDD